MCNEIIHIIKEDTIHTTWILTDGIWNKVTCTPASASRKSTLECDMNAEQGTDKKEKYARQEHKHDNLDINKHTGSTEKDTKYIAPGSLKNTKYDKLNTAI